MGNSQSTSKRPSATLGRRTATPSPQRFGYRTTHTIDGRYTGVPTTTTINANESSHHHQQLHTPVRGGTFNKEVSYANNWLQSSTYAPLPPNAATAPSVVDAPEGHKWIPSSSYSTIPPNAVVCGNDNDGDTIYVGRSFHNGDMLVVQVIPSKHMAFASWRGAEISKDHFEILCGHNMVWRQCFNHIIPQNAVVCGSTSLEQPVYIGRGNYEGSLRVGRISKDHHALFVPFKGIERRLEMYEILVEENFSVGWKIESLTDSVPPPPFTSEMACPYPIEKSCPYPLDIKPAPGLLATKPAMSTPLDPPPPYSAIDTTRPCISMPVAPLTNPAKTYFPQMPALPTFPSPPTQCYPSTSSSSACNSRPCDKWVAASHSHLPGNAVHAGHDSDRSKIYVCRAFHSGDILPGKVVSTHSSAYVSYDGEEIPKSRYEVLVGDHYMWVRAINGCAVGAVEAGRTADGEILYIGRAHYQGSLTCGKIHRSHGCLYIPYGGQEVRIGGKYECLVRRDEYHRGQKGRMY